VYRELDFRFVTPAGMSFWKDMRMTMRKYVLIALFLLGVYVALPATMLGGPDQEAPGWKVLFNGKNLDGWTIAYAKPPFDTRPPSALFEVVDGTIHTYPTDVSGSQQQQAYIQADGDYKEYVLHAEYKWGIKKFPPKMDLPRDAGLMFNIYEDPKENWPHSVEFQIEEGDTADLWALSTRATSTIDPATKLYKPALEGGVPVSVGAYGTFQRIRHSEGVTETPGWNSIDLIVHGDTAVYKVNGVVKMRATDLKEFDSATNSWIRLDHGKVALQAEFNEVYYRNVRIRPLTAEDLR
jgi:hypothetical protein